MKHLRQLFAFLLMISLFFACGAQSENQLANRLKQVKDSIQVKYADSLRYQYADSLQTFISEHSCPDQSLNDIFRKIINQHEHTTKSNYQLTYKQGQDCDIGILSVDDISFEYKENCPGKSAFFCELKFNNQAVISEDLKAIHDIEPINLKDCFPLFEDLNIHIIGKKKYLTFPAYYKGCTGSFCLYSRIILYDFQRDQLYVAIDFHIKGYNDSIGNFCDLNKDGYIDYLSLEYYYEGNEPKNLYEANTVKISVYTQNRYGEFEKMLDKWNQEYYIKVRFDGGFLESRNAQIVESHWMNRLDE